MLKQSKLSGIVLRLSLFLLVLIVFCFTAEPARTADQTISGPFVGDVIGDDNSAAGSSGGSNNLTVTTTGSVTGDVIGSRNSGANSSGGSNTVSNSGTSGSLYGSYNDGSNSNGGSNTVSNSGFTFFISGSYNEGDNSTGGSNTISNTDIADEIIGSWNEGANSSGGSNTITNSGSAPVLIAGSTNFALNSSGGSNTISNSGTTDVIFGSYNAGDNSAGGSNTISNSGTSDSLYGSINLGSNSNGGSNTFSNSGTTDVIFGSYNLGINSAGGSNTISNTGIADQIIGSWNLGANSSGGSNTITNSGSAPVVIVGSANFAFNSSGGSNTISNSGTTDLIFGSYNFGDNSAGGSNTISNSGTTDLIFGSYNEGDNSAGGSNTISNSGTVDEDIYGSLNAGVNSTSTGNTISNFGTVGGDIWGSMNDGAGSSGGDDTITNSGTVKGSIYGADGDDTVILVGGSSLGGVADGGEDSDTLGFNTMGTVDGSLLGTVYLNFENFRIYGGSNTLTGTWDFSGGTTTVHAGDLTVNGTLLTTDLLVNSGTFMSIPGTVNSGATTVDGSMEVGGALTTGSLLVGSSAFMSIPGTVNSGATRVDGSMEVGGALTTGSLLVGSSAFMSIPGTVNSGTTLLDGTMNLNGSLAGSDFTIGSGGFLSGNGTITGNVVNYGTISPGNSIGTMNIAGSLSFMAGSTYVVELSSNGGSDLIKVGGPVKISGGTLRASLPRALYTDGYNWTIITASGGVSGTFSSISTNFTSSTIDLRQSNRNGSVKLVIDRKPYASFGATPNEAAVGTGLDALLPSARGSMAGLLTAMDFDMNPSQIGATLAGLNPEMYTAFPAAGLEAAGIFGQTADQHQQEVRLAGAFPAESRKVPLWNGWFRALGSRLDRDSGDDLTGYELSTGGAVFGADRSFGSVARAGFMLGYSDGDLDWDEGDNSGKITGKYLGFYGSTSYDEFYLDLTAGYTGLANSAERLIATPAVTGSGRADYDAGVWSGSLTAGYDFKPGGLRVGPVASIGYQHLDQDGFSESGTTDFSVTLDSGDAESVISRLGLRLGGLIEGGDWRFLPRGELSWLHLFKDDPVELTAGFAGYPSASFNVSGGDPAKNRVLLSLGLSAEYGTSLTLYADYSMTGSDEQYLRTFSFGLSWLF